MRIALVSPMPPARSGIADYSAALASALGELAKATVISGDQAQFEATAFDQIVYQIGNNSLHAFVYERALEIPGVVVLHEPNLHHLVADMTIRRGDWDGYLREVEYDGGKQALAYARRVRALEAPPDYAGLPMLRRLLERSRAVIVHSTHAEVEVRKAGFCGPLARIPHGARTPEVDGTPYRRSLGLNGKTPLIGVFGFLKPYKRVREALRAFRRLLKRQPSARMLLAGEAHPELPLERIVLESELAESVRLMGYLPPEDLDGYMAACDIVLNLRYPTAGESSGTLLRALGLGKPALVSDVGAFSELPDSICLKVPVGELEEDTLIEYLEMLISRPDVALAMGNRARQWVREECAWDLVARRYVTFMEAIAATGAVSDARSVLREPPAPVDILRWVSGDASTREYVNTHLTRLEKTLRIIPPGGSGDRILEMGAYMQITPSLKLRLGYGEVRGCYFGPAGLVQRHTVKSTDGDSFECDVDLFDAERDSFPYPDGHFTTVLCCELIEHLGRDPMHLLAEINRVLKPGGSIVLTTPNLASLRSVSAVLLGYHPGLFSSFLKPDEGVRGEERHQREYTPIEIHLLLTDSGFEVALLETGPFRESPHPELAWVSDLLERYHLPGDLRGEGIYAVGRKTRAVQQRYPSWLYSKPNS
jgi:glycosyltransferase involved in cell wall biosynthesis/SAM-dependent methyltransferase